MSRSMSRFMSTGVIVGRLGERRLSFTRYSTTNILATLSRRFRSAFISLAHSPTIETLCTRALAVTLAMSARHLPTTSELSAVSRVLTADFSAAAVMAGPIPPPRIGVCLTQARRSRAIGTAILGRVDIEHDIEHHWVHFPPRALLARTATRMRRR